MAGRSAIAKYKVARMKPRGLVVERPVEKSVLFGTPDDRKSIAILAGVGFLLLGIAHYLVAMGEPKFSILALLFTSVHGALIGMLLGQLMLVYPDRVMVIFTILAALLGEGIYLGGSGKLEPFVFNRELFQAIVAIMFWAGFIGFWVGYIVYARGRQERARFRTRMEQQRQDRIPPEL